MSKSVIGELLGYVEALQRIAGFTLPQFMGPNDMALECVNVARAALGEVCRPKGKCCMPLATIDYTHLFEYATDNGLNYNELCAVVKCSLGA